MFENLKDMMGDAYKEDMTAEDVNNFFAGKKFTDLSTGLYVDKNKYERDIQSLQATIAEKQNALNAKLTDDEKAQQEKLNKDKEIQRLTELLKTNTLNSNKSMAIGNTADVKSILKIEEDDTEFATFLDNIVSEDGAKTTAIAKYINKAVKDAYEKGKQDATKDSMGDFGKKTKGDTSKSKEDDLGSRLAKLNSPKTQTVDYFKR